MPAPLCLATLNPIKGRGKIILLLLVIFGALQVIFATSTYIGSVSVVFVIAGLLGMSQSSLFPLITAVLLQTAPENLRGRVMGLLNIDRSFATIGVVVGGLLSATVGSQLGQIYFGMACVFATLGILTFHPNLRRID